MYLGVKMIYFDNASTTTPIGSPKLFYNPSSPHTLGIKAERALREAREKIASTLNDLNNRTNNMSHKKVTSDEIIFTSGGTESNNLAILGYVLANIRKGINLIFAAYEHPSITGPAQFAYEQKWANSTSFERIPPGNALISVSQINHETGDINNISEIAAGIKDKNPDVLIHVDGAQGFCKEKINLSEIDIYTFSGHKIHGPLGVGGLWVRKGINLSPLTYGGGQELGMRAGTENAPGIIQMTEAMEILASRIDISHSHVTAIKQALLNLRDILPDVEVNSLSENTSPYILNLSFLGVKGEVLVHALSEKGVFVSMGAACRSRKKPHGALELMGFSSERAQSAIRFSFSPFNTLEEAEQAKGIVIGEVKRFRKMKGYL